MNLPGYRISLEQIILGACLLENGYQVVADVLSAKNFLAADPERGLYLSHQQIYHAFEKLYPARPINLISVRRELTSEYRDYISQLALMVSSTEDLRFHAFVLLEYNLRGSFIELLHKEFSSGKYNTATQQAIQEIIDESLDNDNDIFEVISASRLHLHNIMADDSLVQAVADFEIKIDKRIESIKRQASIDCLVNNLSNLNRLPHDTTTKMAVSHLTDILKNILATGKADQKLANKIFELKL